MKTIIAGSRTIKDSKAVIFAALNVYFSGKLPAEVVSGCARGVDTYGEEWAKSKGVTVKRFPANWDKHGKKAGYLRNLEMGNYADQALIFWDGESRGTRSMIEIMQKLKKPYYVWKP
jgi:SLOG family YspA-like protein